MPIESSGPAQPGLDAACRVGIEQHHLDASDTFSSQARGESGLHVLIPEMCGYGLFLVSGHSCTLAHGGFRRDLQGVTRVVYVIKSRGQRYSAFVES